tara:strand:- start:914 stop:2191 length:1278 start_codon:yes stop_codon:yes gene_type:complete
MGLLKQTDNQHYSVKKSWKVLTAGTTIYYVSSTRGSFHDHHTALASINALNPFVKVYIDNVLYPQRVVDETNPAQTLQRWKFFFDPGAVNSNSWILEFDSSYIPSLGSTIDIEIDNSIWFDPVSGVTEQTTNNYQVTSLEDIINNFMIAYTGEDKIINKVSRTDVQFHAMRGLQEMSFDTFKSCKSQEFEVPPSLTMMLPRDYVNYVKLSWKDSTGVKRVIYPTKYTSNPLAIKQKTTVNDEFEQAQVGDPNFNSDDGTYYVDTNDLIYNKNSDTWNSYKSSSSSEDNNRSHRDDEDGIYWPNEGRRYGISPENAQVNGSYYIDCNKGMIHFSSALSGLTVVIDYISDSLGTDSEMVVHKMAEEAMYKWIICAIMSTRANVPEHAIQRYKKEKRATMRTAKLRLSNIKLEEITQILRGKSKFIKH